MNRVHIVRMVTVLMVAALASLSWLPRAPTRVHAAAPLARVATLIQDPHAGGGGDMQQDNVYGFNNFVCTDGLAINIDYQSMGDVNNDATHQGHSLELRSIQHYSSSTNTDPNATSTNLNITQGTTVLSGGTTTADVGSNSWTFASANDNTAGSWQGNTYIAHYSSIPVGDEVVGSIVRRDHGFVLNEDDDRDGGPAAHPNDNGDDSNVLNGVVFTDPTQYQGWLSVDDTNDSVTSPMTPPNPPNPDGDWTPNTDGSSFDDIIRTDQVPANYDASNPNNSPSFLVVPNPSTSTVEDCVVEQQAPQTDARFCTTTTPTLDSHGNPSCPTTPTPDGSNGWYQHTVYVFFVHHLIYYPVTSVSTNYSLTENGSSTPQTGTITDGNYLTLTDGRYTNLKFSSVDNLSDTETPTTAVSVNVDTVKPVLACTTTPTFTIGQTPAQVTATATDATSGMLNGVTSVSSAANTTQPGAFTASLNGQDVAGNSSTINCPYTVEFGIQLLYKSPMSAKSGSTIPIKLELVNATGTNLSSAGIGVQALCVVPTGNTDCTHAVATNTGPFTFLTMLAPGGGYQFNLKTTGVPTGNYTLLFRVAGESSTTFHAAAGATLILTK